MNKLNYRFFYYKTRASYEKDSMYDRIPEDAIIFIEEPRMIITHNTEYVCAESENPAVASIAQMLTLLFESKQDKLVAGDGISIDGNVISSTLGEDVADHVKTAVDQYLNGQSEDGDGTVLEKIAQQIINSLTEDADSSAAFTEKLVQDGILYVREDNGKIDIDGDKLTQFINAVSGGSQAPSVAYTAGEGINISSNNVISANVDDIAEKLTTSQEGETNQFIEQIIQNLFDTEHMSDEQIAELATKLSSLVTDEEVGSVYTKSLVYTKSEVDSKIAEAGFGNLTPEEKEAILNLLGIDNFNNWNITENENDHALVFTKQ